MGRALVPAANVRDQLGTQAKPWDRIFTKVLYDQDGNIAAFIPMSASDIDRGLLGADRINLLNPSTALAGVTPTRTLAAISADAATGSGDPVTRINSGSSLINGSKLSPHTVSPEALDPVGKLLHALLVGNAGSLESDDYDGAAAGFKISKTTVAFYLASAVFAGILKGTINIGMFNVDGTGKAIWRNPTNAPDGFTIEADGRAYFGSDAYVDAPTQFDAQGNFYLNDTPASLSRIDLGAIDATCKGVQPSQAGGQFSGNLELKPLTRGAGIYYVLYNTAAPPANTDPTDPTNTNRVKYAGPFSVDTSGGNKTVKAAAVKLGTFGPVSTWAFTTSASVTAAPTFDPIPGYYTTRNSTYPVSLSSGTPGATIIYTTDGTIPTDSNGTTYSGPIAVPRGGTTTIKAFAKHPTSPTLTASAVVTGIYTIRKGSTPGDGSGGNEGGTF